MSEFEGIFTSCGCEGRVEVCLTTRVPWEAACVRGISKTVYTRLQRQPTQSRDIGVRAGEQPHVDRDLGTRAVDSERLVEASRSLQQ